MAHVATRNEPRDQGHVACYAVLSLPELLENILSRLSMQSLLTVAQRVDKRWNATISGSPSLQRILHFQAQPCVGDGERRQNPLLVATFPAWFANASANFYRREFETQLGGEEALMQRGASWRRMLVAQPPIQKLGCWMAEWHGDYRAEDKAWKFKILGIPHGLRMGALYDRVVRWMSTSDNPHFLLAWTPKDIHELPVNGSVMPRPTTKERSDLVRCFAAVDLVLRGEGNGWNTRSEATGTRDDRMFRRRYTYKY